MNISIVVPVYNGENNILSVYREIKNILQNNYKSYEIIYVDDGSKDRTPYILRDISKNDEKVRVISLSKNYGQHKALVEGFKNCKSNIIISTDCDLECNSQDIPKFVEEIYQGYDIVCGVRYERKTTLVRRYTSYIFNKIFSILTGIKLQDVGCPLKAYTKNVVDEIIKAGDIPSSIFGWKKFKISEIKIETTYQKNSTYNFFKLICLAIYVIRKYIHFLFISFLKSK